MLDTAQNRPELPPEIARRAHHGLELTESLLNRPDAVDILKRASLR